MSRHQIDENHNSFDWETVDERKRLVKLCGRLSGDFTVAEDLAQETLLEAHRNAVKPGTRLPG